MTYLFKNITTEEELDRALTFEKRVFKDSKHHSLTAYSKDSWLERLQRYSELMLFAEADGEVVGLVFARIEEDGSATVGPVATDPRCRNQGLARALMMLIEVRAQARGIRTLTLGAVAEAEGFYLKCGYTPYLFLQAKTPLTLAELRGLNQAYKEVWSYEDGREVRLMLDTEGINKALQHAYDVTFPGCATQTLFVKQLG